MGSIFQNTGLEQTDPLKPKTGNGNDDRDTTIAHLLMASGYTSAPTDRATTAAYSSTSNISDYLFKANDTSTVAPLRATDSIRAAESVPISTAPPLIRSALTANLLSPEPTVVKALVAPDDPNSRNLSQTDIAPPRPVSTQAELPVLRMLKENSAAVPVTAQIAEGTSGAVSPGVVNAGVLAGKPETQPLTVVTKPESQTLTAANLRPESQPLATRQEAPLAVPTAPLKAVVANVQPAGNNGDLRPVANNGDLRPAATNGEPRPVAMNGEPRPAANNGDLRPAATNGDPRPAANNGDLRPVAMNGDPRPAATNGDLRPVAMNGDPRPAATNGDPRPAANNGDLRPVATNGDPRPAPINGDLRPGSAVASAVSTPDSRTSDTNASNRVDASNNGSPRPLEGAPVVNSSSPTRTDNPLAPVLVAPTPRLVSSDGSTATNPTQVRFDLGPSAQNQTRAEGTQITAANTRTDAQASGLPPAPVPTRIDNNVNAIARDATSTRDVPLPQPTSVPHSVNNLINQLSQPGVIAPDLQVRVAPANDRLTKDNCNPGSAAIASTSTIDRQLPSNAVPTSSTDRGPLLPAGRTADGSDSNPKSNSTGAIQNGMGALPATPSDRVDRSVGPLPGTVSEKPSSSGAPDTSASRPTNDAQTRVPAPTDLRSAFDNNGRPGTDNNPRTSVDNNGRPVADNNPRTSVDNNGRPLADNNGRPGVDSNPRTAVDNGRTVADNGRPVVDNNPRTSVDNNGRPVADNNGRPGVDNNPRTAVDNNGRPVADNNGRPVADNGRPGADHNPRTTVDNNGRPVADNNGRPGVDSNGRPGVDSNVRPGSQGDQSKPDGLSRTVQDGRVPDARNPDGRNPDGRTPDGRTLDARNPDGRTPDGRTPDGRTQDTPRTSAEGRPIDGARTGQDGRTLDSQRPDGRQQDGSRPGLEGRPQEGNRIPQDRGQEVPKTDFRSQESSKTLPDGRPQDGQRTNLENRPQDGQRANTEAGRFEPNRNINQEGIRTSDQKNTEVSKGELGRTGPNEGRTTDGGKTNSDGSGVRVNEHVRNNEGLSNRASEQSGRNNEGMTNRATEQSGRNNEGMTNRATEQSGRNNEGANNRPSDLSGRNQDTVRNADQNTGSKSIDGAQIRNPEIGSSVRTENQSGKLETSRPDSASNRIAPDSIPQSASTRPGEVRAENTSNRTGEPRPENIANRTGDPRPENIANRTGDPRPENIANRTGDPRPENLAIPNTRPNDSVIDAKSADQNIVRHTDLTNVRIDGSKALDGDAGKLSDRAGMNIEARQPQISLPTDLVATQKEAAAIRQVLNELKQNQNLTSSEVLELPSFKEAMRLFEALKPKDVAETPDGKQHFTTSFVEAMRLSDFLKVLEKASELEQKKVHKQQWAARSLSQNQHRVRYLVQKNDTLESIAEKILGDIRFVQLLVTINRAEIIFTYVNGKSFSTVYEGQYLWIPTPNEVSIHRKHYFNANSSAGRGEPIAPEAETPIMVEEYEAPTTVRDFATRLRSVTAPPVGAHGEASDPSNGHANGPSNGPVSSPMAVVLYRLRFAGNRNSVNLDEVVEETPEEEERRQYKVRLGETLQSIAVNDELMKDVNMWVLICRINGLDTSVDVVGRPRAQLTRGDIIKLPNQADVEEFKLLNRLMEIAELSGKKIDIDLSRKPAPAKATAAKPAPRCKVDRQMQIEKLWERCRMILTDNNDTSYSIKLQRDTLEGKWTTVASYESKGGKTLRWTYKIDGTKNCLEVGLPAAVSREMAIEDFQRNWRFYYNRYTSIKTDTLELLDLSEVANR